MNNNQNEIKLKLQKAWNVMTDEEKFDLVFSDISKNNNVNLAKKLMERYAVHIDNNTDIDERCDFCQYNTCSEHDDCIEGIFDKLMSQLQLEEVNLYDIFQKHSYSQLKELFKNSKTKDEQDFYMVLSNMVLQKQQLNVIGKNEK